MIKPNYIDPRDCPVCSGRGWTPHHHDDEPVWIASPCECLARCRCCEGTGTEFTSSNGETYGIDCRVCTPLRYTAIRISAAGIPRRYQLGEFTPMNQQQTELISYMISWLRQFSDGKGWLLCGPTGVGKSQVMVWVLQQLAAEDCRVSWISLRQWLDTREPGEWVTLPRMTDVMAIDDMMPLRNDWERSMVSTLLTARYDRRLTTLMTTNLPPDGKYRLIERIVGTEHADRIHSRFCETTRILECGGPDLREM